MESTLGKRSHWEARREGGREGAPSGVNKPASSPSSQQRGKLRLRGLSAAEEGGSCPLAEPICPHPLVPLSPGWGAEQVHSMPTDLNSTVPRRAA